MFQKLTQEKEYLIDESCEMTEHGGEMLSFLPPLVKTSTGDGRIGRRDRGQRGIGPPAKWYVFTR